MASPPHVVVLYEGVSAAEATGALAAVRAAGLPAELAGAEALVHAREGVRLVPTRLGYASLAEAPSVIVPGGEVGPALADAALVRALRSRRGKWTLFSGAAVRLAHAAGLTEGRRIARLPGDEPIDGATPTASRLVADGRLLTCFAGDATIDLTLHLVSVLEGHPTAQRAAAALGRELNVFAFGETTHAGR